MEVAAPFIFLILLSFLYAPIITTVFACGVFIACMIGGIINSDDFKSMLKTVVIFSALCAYAIGLGMMSYNADDEDDDGGPSYDSFSCERYVYKLKSRHSSSSNSTSTSNSSSSKYNTSTSNSSSNKHNTSTSSSSSNKHNTSSSGYIDFDPDDYDDPDEYAEDAYDSDFDDWDDAYDYWEDY